LGHKGVSKRKPSQKKAKKMSIVNASSDVSAVGRTAGSQPLKLSYTEKVADPASNDGVKRSKDSRKNPKKR